MNAKFDFECNSVNKWKTFHAIDRNRYCKIPLITLHLRFSSCNDIQRLKWNVVKRTVRFLHCLISLDSIRSTQLRNFLFKTSNISLLQQFHQKTASSKGVFLPLSSHPLPQLKRNPGNLKHIDRWSLPVQLGTQGQHRSRRHGMSGKGNRGIRLQAGKSKTINRVAGGISKDNNVVLGEKQGILRVELIIAVRGHAGQGGRFDSLSQRHPGPVIFSARIAKAVDKYRRRRTHMPFLC